MPAYSFTSRRRSEQPIRRATAGPMNEIIMELKFYCHSCAQPIAVEDTWAGLEVQCPTCRAGLRIPTAPGLLPVPARPVLAQASPRSESNPTTESAWQWPLWLQPLRQIPGQARRTTKASYHPGSSTLSFDKSLSFGKPGGSRSRSVMMMFDAM